MKKPIPRQTAVEKRVAKLIASHKRLIGAMLRGAADDRSELWQAVRELQAQRLKPIPQHIIDLAANTMKIESTLKQLSARIDKNHDECSKGGNRLLQYDHDIDVRVKALEAALPRENTEVLLRLHG